jgi:hypothetical protein
MKIRLIVALAGVAALLVSAGAGAASPVTRAQAEQLTKRTASQTVRTNMHRNLPPAAWTASCRRDGAGWWQCGADSGTANCYVGAAVGGTQTQPIVTRVHAVCIR